MDAPLAIEQRIARALELGDSGWSASSTRVGNGQVAECARWVFTRDGHEIASVIAKTPSRDETSRSTAQLQHLYRRETAFYERLQPQLAIRTPQPIHVEYHEDSDDFLIVLEDLTPTADVDQFSGLSLEQATIALGELAGLHGPTANRTDLFAQEWLGGVATSLAPLYEVVLPILFEQFIDRYGAEIDVATRSTVEQLAMRLGDFGGLTAHTSCVVHGDFRSDNLLFAGRGGAVPLAVVDWQTISVNSPMLDVAYFITTSLTPQDRADHENELLSLYLERLREYGVDLPLEHARHEFARYTLQPIVMLVAASVIVERTDRGDAMFLTMIRRAVDAVADWNAFSELD